MKNDERQENIMNNIVKELAIQEVIEMAIKMNVSEDIIIKNVCERYNIDKQTAQEYFDRYALAQKA